jgi:hypothetical protein
LRDLVDRRLDVLDRDHRTDRILHPVIGHGRHINADVVLGDDPLRLDRHRDDPQRHAMNPIDERHDEDQPGTTRAILDLAQFKQHHTLVLLDDPNRHREAHEQHAHDHDDRVKAVMACTQRSNRPSTER